jgi:hypothetical protein
MPTTITRSTDGTLIVPALVLNAWQSDDAPQTIIHPILGLEYPDVTLRPAAARTGTMRLLFLDAAAADAARQFHRAPATFTTVSSLAWVPTKYVPNGPIRAVQQDGEARWVLEVPYQELAS